MANDKTEIKFDKKGLEELERMLKNQYYLRIGIIGSKAQGQHDKDSGLTNAELGSIHEQPDGKGKKMPRRSFLEDSLKLKLNFNDEQFKEMRKSLFNKVFDKQKPIEFLNELGVKCLQIIEEGFETNGFGLWKPVAKQKERDDEVLDNLGKLSRKASRLESNLKTYEDLDKLIALRSRIKKLKTNFIEYGSKILTDTGKLRHSITFKVMKKK